MSRFYLTTPAIAHLDQGVLADLSVSREGVVRELLEEDLGARLDAAEREAMAILQPDSLGSHPRISNKTKAAREVLYVCRMKREDLLPRNSSAVIPFLIKSNPLAAAALLSGFDLFDHAENSKFLSLPEFARAYAVEMLNQHKHRSRGRDTYDWAGPDMHYTIYTSRHGDMVYQQVDVGAPVIQTDMFDGESLFAFESIIDTQTNERRCSSLRLYQDGSPMLCALLDFARREGMSRIAEIAEWQSVLKEVGEYYTNTAEALGFGTDEDTVKRLLEDVLLNRNYLAESDEGKKCGYLSWWVPSYGSDGVFFYPFYTPGELLFLKSEPKRKYLYLVITCSNSLGD